MVNDYVSILKYRGLDYGLRITEVELDLFRIYLNELLFWNQKINLTGLSVAKDIVNELMLDSIIPVPFLPEKGKMLDIGSGAGFPGIPLKICLPHIKLHLLEPISKRVSFLKQIIRLLRLQNIEVIDDRIEKAGGRLDTEGYDIIVSRAVAEPAQIIKWCDSFLSQNGLLVCFLGKEAENILINLQHVMGNYSLELLNKITYILPGKDSTRTIIVLQKR